MYDSEVMCLKKVDTPWSIYRDFTVYYFTLFYIRRDILTQINAKKDLIEKKTITN